MVFLLLKKVTGMMLTVAEIADLGKVPSSSHSVQHGAVKNRFQIESIATGSISYVRASCTKIAILYVISASDKQGGICRGRRAISQSLVSLFHPTDWKFSIPVWEDYFTCHSTWMAQPPKIGC